MVIINYFFSEKYLTYLYYSLPFAKQLNQSQLGISVNKVTTDLEKSSRISQTTTMLEEDIDAYELLKTAEDTIKVYLNPLAIIFIYYYILYSDDVNLLDSSYGTQSAVRNCLS